MSMSWQLKIYENQQLVYSANLSGPAEIGRQKTKEPPPYHLITPEGKPQRVIIAHLKEDKISREHILIESVANGLVRLKNIRKELPIPLPDGTELRPAATCELSLPVSLNLGSQ